MNMKLETLSAFVLVLISAVSEVWCGVSACTYLESSDGHTIIRTIPCRYGCCGEDKKQECCDPEMNYLMIAVFGIVGLLLIVVILLTIFVFIKKKNVCRTRVENSSNHQADNLVNHRAESIRHPEANYINMSEYRANPAPHPRPIWPPASTNMPSLYTSDPPPYSLRSSEKENEKPDQWGKTFDL